MYSLIDVLLLILAFMLALIFTTSLFLQISIGALLLGLVVAMILNPVYDLDDDLKS